jgi:hypothetical protein
MLDAIAALFGILSAGIFLVHAFDAFRSMA